ncbi:MAG: nucleotidyl transferase AbiEii/AbiGii toxin family protein [Patescibacteria group bacterium]
MHAGTLSLHAQNVLAQLGDSGVVSQMYLVGGTALALQLGHRMSQDFDFCVKGNVLAENIARDLGGVGKFSVDLLEPPHTLLGTFEEVKVSVFRYDYEMLEPLSVYRNVALASVKDIAAMKLSAICGRATKRDYVDVYVLSQLYNFDEQFSWYDKKYGELGNNIYTLIKALGYFEDAEIDKMPEMLIPLEWEQVKSFLLAQSLRLGKKLL